MLSGANELVSYPKIRKNRTEIDSALFVVRKVKTDACYEVNRQAMRILGILSKKHKIKMGKAKSTPDGAFTKLLHPKNMDSLDREVLALQLENYTRKGVRITVTGDVIYVAFD